MAVKLSHFVLECCSAVLLLICSCNPLQQKNSLYRLLRLLGSTSHTLSYPSIPRSLQVSTHLLKRTLIQTLIRIQYTPQTFLHPRILVSHPPTLMHTMLHSQTHPFTYILIAYFPCNCFKFYYIQKFSHF